VDQILNFKQINQNFLRRKGKVVTQEGVRPNPKKIEAIKLFPLPKTPKEIKSFLGLIGLLQKVHKRFCKNNQTIN